MSYIYNVTDYGNLDSWFPSQVEAITFAKKANEEDVNGDFGEISVTKHTIATPNLRLICDILESSGGNFSQASEVVLRLPIYSRI